MIRLIAVNSSTFRESNKASDVVNSDRNLCLLWQDGTKCSAPVIARLQGMSRCSMARAYQISPRAGSSSSIMHFSKWIMHHYIDEHSKNTFGVCSVVYSYCRERWRSSGVLRVSQRFKNVQSYK
ncbi:hypothetical protein NPIL_377511 [Nephila pilipes]|uniref:Uncharacterized protein n=1 Tax=Nephila pilipes TaxID=299642 RepID=A0A8X6IXT1_NEPPI|nr:hypothetical protein NPIL_377511 [Nephila pilipes]